MERTLAACSPNGSPGGGVGWGGQENSPSPGGVLAPAYHEALRHRPPCWAVSQEIVEEYTPLS